MSDVEARCDDERCAWSTPVTDDHFALRAMTTHTETSGHAWFLVSAEGRPWRRYSTVVSDDLRGQLIKLAGLTREQLHEAERATAIAWYYSTPSGGTGGRSDLPDPKIFPHGLTLPDGTWLPPARPSRDSVGLFQLRGLGPRGLVDDGPSTAPVPDPDDAARDSPASYSESPPSGAP